MAATQEQFKYMLDFFVLHKDVAKGFANSIEGRARSKRMWEELANDLNSLGGTTKTIKQWQKVWSDRKYMAKKAISSAKKCATSTGGGPSTAPTLSDIEQKIISIMGKGFGEPQVDGRVPAFYEADVAEILPVLESQKTPPNVPCPDDRPDPPDPGQAQSSSSQQPRCSSPTPPRIRRIKRRKEHFLEKFLEIEERRLSIEKENAKALQDMTLAVKELCVLLKSNNANK